MQKIPREDFLLKETKPSLGGVKVTGYDLVEKMLYLYVRVVKAKDLLARDINGSCDPYVEVEQGNYKGITRHFKRNSNPEWNQVFAFSVLNTIPQPSIQPSMLLQDVQLCLCSNLQFPFDLFYSEARFQSSVLEVTVKHKDFVNDDLMGRVLFDLNEIEERVPQDSPLAAQWYKLEDRKGDKVNGELMLAVWMGTQADEAFPEAWNSDAVGVSGTEGVANIRSKVYLSPKLWYLRVNVIEAQNLHPSDMGRFPEVFVKAILGNQVLSTGICQSGNNNPRWNEDLMFVVAEPIEGPLILRVEDNDEVLGRCTIALQYVDRRDDNTPINAEWYTLEKHVVVQGEEKKETKVVCKIHARICLEGGYHVLDESINYSSDLQPTSKQLWNSSIGVLKLGILNAQKLMSMKTKDGRGRTDAYCVAKYGQKWVRTRTIIDSLDPKWNEQYSWEVFDPCTVVTIGVFDNCFFNGRDKYGWAKDLSIGKTRIRLSTLETGRIYTHLYPLLVLNSEGVKKVGEIELALRFTCSSLLNMMHVYSQPLLPKMHYLHPLTVSEHNNLRLEAVQIVSMRFSLADPPLRKEVVEYMLDEGTQMWSMRRSKANYFRITGILSGLIAVGRWFDLICNWINPGITVLVHIMFIILVMYPELIVATIFLYLFLIGIWYYRCRPRHPPQYIGALLSHADTALPDELDEEFDTIPTSLPTDIVRMRYDRLRSFAGRIQTVLGDLAALAERLQSLLSWRDPKATALFVILFLVATIVVHVTPFQVLVLLTGLYLLRHPRFRDKLPSVPSNFFLRFPARTDIWLVEHNENQTALAFFQWLTADVGS
ncbi:hypothetical protein FH972_016893 [Carpinus fangiana]|uniref:C2 domain-containing protein n=1 Tax=Carpinus fangiana TaxID=176857 RepID=A0A5N6RKR2_9ROSI|nr:hypothetical protein FH972_016893 [Carpinus fangiana]